MDKRTINAINTIGDFCGRRDIDALTKKAIYEKTGLHQVDVMVLFGGSIMAGGDVMAEAINNDIAKTYIIVGGAGHTTETLRQKVHSEYPSVETEGLTEAEVFTNYLKELYGVEADYLEKESTNCGNNISYLLNLIKEHHISCQSILLSQDATMQLRMHATLKKFVPDDVLILNYATYHAEVVEKNGEPVYKEEIHGMWDMERYITLLMGEMVRLPDNKDGYGPNGTGYIAHVDIPEEVTEAFQILKQEHEDKIRVANKAFASKKAGIVACSNPKDPAFEPRLTMLCQELTARGYVPVVSDYIYDRGDGFAGSGQERAKALMELYENPEVDAIFDISGGDMANEVIPYLDFDIIAKSKATFYGYSDLTTILNAITTKTGKESVLYQISHILIHANGPEYDIPYTMIQGDSMEGTLAGGNIRCFLKLAGTEYFPDLHGKILLLEAMGGGLPQMVTFLSQLKMMGAFDQVNGILLGTFSKMEQEGICPDIVSLVRYIAGDSLPIAKTQFIGHGTDAKAAVIGRKYHFEKEGF